MDKPKSEIEFWDRYSVLVKKAWESEDFKKRCLAEPKVVFQELGILVKDGMDIKIYEDTDSVRHLPIPVQQPAVEMNKTEVGTTLGSWFCCHTWSSEETSHG